MWKEAMTLKVRGGVYGAVWWTKGKQEMVLIM